MKWASNVRTGSPSKPSQFDSGEFSALDPPDRPTRMPRSRLNESGAEAYDPVLHQPAFNDGNDPHGPKGGHLGNSQSRYLFALPPPL